MSDSSKPSDSKPLLDAPSASIPSLSPSMSPSTDPLNAPSTPAPSRPSSPPPCPPPPPPSPVGRTINVGSPSEQVADVQGAGPGAVPELPKRDYPVALPPLVVTAARSRLPAMLRALASTLTYVGAGSGVLVVLYLRFILPLLEHTLSSRAALNTRALTLASKLATLLSALPSSCIPAPSTPHPIVALSTATKTLSSLPHGSQSQQTLQSVTGLTSYISAQTYGSGAGVTGKAAGELEGARREVRAIRGLVLNRRSFAPIAPSAVSTP